MTKEFTMTIDEALKQIAGASLDVENAVPLSKDFEFALKVARDRLVTSIKDYDPVEVAPQKFDIAKLACHLASYGFKIQTEIGAISKVSFVGAFVAAAHLVGQMLVEGENEAHDREFIEVAIAVGNLVGREVYRDAANARQTADPSEYQDKCDCEECAKQPAHRSIQ